MNDIVRNPLNLREGSWTEIPVNTDYLRKIVAVFKTAGADVTDAEMGTLPDTSSWTVGWFPGTGVKVTTNGLNAMKGLTNMVEAMDFYKAFDEIEATTPKPPSQLSRIDRIEVDDRRPDPDPLDGSIPASGAIPGRLYETGTGRTVMAVYVPAKGVEEVLGGNLVFMGADGWAYPNVWRDRLWPLDGTVRWDVIGGGK